MYSDKQFFILKAKLAVHWGLVSRIVPYSKSRRVLKLPPPTTLIGALTYPFAYYKRVPENITITLSSANKFKGMIISAHASLASPASIYGDINRVYWYHKARKQAKTDAVALEKLYLTPSEDQEHPILNVIYIIDPEVAKNLIGFWWSETLEALAWSITRIGQRESIVSTLDVKSKLTRPESINTIETTYYLPLNVVERVESGEYTLQEYVPPIVEIGEYSDVEKIPYIIPFSFIESKPSTVNVRLKSNALVLRIDSDSVVFDSGWVKRES